MLTLDDSRGFSLLIWAEKQVPLSGAMKHGDKAECYIQIRE